MKSHLKIRAVLVLSILTTGFTSIQSQTAITTKTALIKCGPTKDVLVGPFKL